MSKSTVNDQSIRDRAFKTLDDLIEKREPQEAVLLGQFMHCHLVVEKYLTHYIEALIPAMDWQQYGGFKYFGQKLEFISLMKESLPSSYMDGLRALNGIRNDFAHRLTHTKIDNKKIERLVSALPNGWNSHLEETRTLVRAEGGYTAEQLFLINIFTKSLCSYICGAITELADSSGNDTVLRKILSEIQESTESNTP